MQKQSAGLLLFRGAPPAIEVLLVHPGGPFWANKDDGAWSIPKGEFTDEEDALRAAVREFKEEMGDDIGASDFIALAPQRQAGGKIVHAWAVQADFDPARLHSNTFSIEWPPRSGRHQIFPEIDRAAWLPLDIARRKILKGQIGLLEELERTLS
jgi:predicted NUDIX family NTP pyrophosphohydrolase